MFPSDKHKVDVAWINDFRRRVNVKHCRFTATPCLNYVPQSFQTREKWLFTRSYFAKCRFI